MYDVTSYFFAKITSELPMSIFIPLIFDVIVYFAIGLNTTHPYIFFIFGKNINNINIKLKFI
jgi:hypothetical protein